MKKLEKVITEWKEFFIKDVLKKVEEEIGEDIEILIDSLKDEGIIKE